MLAPSSCQCGTRMEIRGAYNWCAHCDEPHKTTATRNACRECDNLRAAGGIGPSS